uniref:AAA-ATPase-like domain-containing protein n=1 Tax=Schizaphis graminum TaxID=13262 RepID=A0A2S2N7P5_SCHGA
MGEKFEGFEGCFNMTFNASNNIPLLYLRDMNINRKEVEIKIAKGTVSKNDIMGQLKFELQLFDSLLKKIDSKTREMKCCTVLNNVISILTKRINNLWNTIYLLFDINDELEPEILNVSEDFLTSRCSTCANCEVSIQRIISSIEIITFKDDAVFNFSSSDFPKILQTTGFVDKTLMIKEVFRNKNIKGTVITAPRKYGKSTNLTMLKYFLEIQVDSLGKPITKAKSGKPIIDTSNYELFKTLKISKEAKIMNEHFGKHPVMYANFKTENVINSYSSVIEGYKEIVHKSFELHKYLQISNKLSNEQRKMSKLWCGSASYKKIDCNEVSLGLRSLCKFLTKHYNKPCFVLIDELDSLTITGIIAETLVTDYKNIFVFLKQILAFLKNNKYVYRAFVTGKSVYNIHGLVPSCIEIQPFSNFHGFTDFFGLTNNELEYLFKKPEFKVVTTIEEVKAYYGAYNKIDVLTKAKKQIYCMWSVLNVLKRRRIDNYWQDFGTFFCNFSVPSIRSIMEKLLANESIVVMFYDSTESKTYPTPPPVFKPSENHLNKNSLNYLFNMLLDLGYLTCSTASLLVLDLQNSTNSYIGYIKIPNEEIRHDVDSKIALLS